MTNVISYSNKSGFTLIELLVVAAIIGILLALAIPNLLKARISANEANARKMMQVLRDAEFEYFEMDLNDNSNKEFTATIGSLNVADSLRDPIGNGNEIDSLVDNTFEGAIVDDGNQASSATCLSPKQGFCLSWTGDLDINDSVLSADFGWEVSPSSIGTTGNRDYSVFVDSTIRCILSTEPKGNNGSFESTRDDPDCF